MFIYNDAGVEPAINFIRESTAWTGDCMFATDIYETVFHFSGILQKQEVFLVQTCWDIGSYRHRHFGVEEMFPIGSLSQRNLSLQSLFQGERFPTRGVTSKKKYRTGFGHDEMGCTWWLIPLSKWVITPVINGISRVNPLITGVITHLRAVG